MKKNSISRHPQRISDLVALIEIGARVTCQTSFAVIPVDFRHRRNPYQAHVFLVYFSGMTDGEPYTFRKCYARGCSHNLCPHVSQAVLIANRYLQRDYRLLEKAGLAVDPRLFTLEDMLVKFEGYREEHPPSQTIEDYLHLAQEGKEVVVEVELEYVPAVEHFANYQNAQTFLVAGFTVICGGKSDFLERCLACFASDKEKEEKAPMVSVANARLKELYQVFEQGAIFCVKRYF
jgi:hypothetical protein